LEDILLVSFMHLLYLFAFCTLFMLYCIFMLYCEKCAALCIVVYCF
jgi:hypothetical protein